MGVPEDMTRLLLQRVLESNDEDEQVLNSTLAEGETAAVAENEKVTKEMTIKAYYAEEIKPLMSLAKYFNSLVAFLLGLFVALNISRWWTMRSSYINGLHKTTKNITTALA